MFIYDCSVNFSTAEYWIDKKILVIIFYLLENTNIKPAQDALINLAIKYKDNIQELAIENADKIIDREKRSSYLQKAVSEENPSNSSESSSNSAGSPGWLQIPVTEV